MDAPWWPHAPLHRLAEAGNYFVTAATYQKFHHFIDASRLDFLQESLMHVARQFGWSLEAWALFSNHYHFVGAAPENCEVPQSLSYMLNALHRRTASELNRLERKPGRKIWHNFWDSKLTFQKSYLARLNYVHHNAVKHGMVAVGKPISVVLGGVG